MNLRTEYLGLELAHPIVASASPITASIDDIRRLEDAGAAALVMPSLFEEQLRKESEATERLMVAGGDSFPEAMSYFPEVAGHRGGLDRYLEVLRRASETTDIPVIASLNGVSAEGWVGYATGLEQAGADALELNVYYIPADMAESGRDVEERYLEVVRAVKAAVSIPVAVKVGSNFSAFGQMAKEIVWAGADGLVLFNRFYQPDFDIEKLEAARTLDLSTPAEIRPGLLWLALLHGRIGASLAASTGVETFREVVKYLMAGADVVMTTSSLLRHGPEHLVRLREGLTEWLLERDYSSVADLRGCMSLDRVPDASAYERANYIRILEEFEPPEGA
jgi:dihydroorotate dehydrogenase (fumarate)